MTIQMIFYGNQKYNEGALAKILFFFPQNDVNFPQYDALNALLCVNFLNALFW